MTAKLHPKEPVSVACEVCLEEFQDQSQQAMKPMNTRNISAASNVTPHGRLKKSRNRLQIITTNPD